MTSTPNSVLITGASGFIGKRLVKHLANQVGGPHVIACVRSCSDSPIDKVSFFQTGCLSGSVNWLPALEHTESVVHCAARVHVLNDRSSDPLADFRRINVGATEELARQAASAGVRRFVFLSSAKVNGESTDFGPPFSADQAANPIDPYGVSKFEAEQILQKVSSETGMEVVIIRPPLVYGPGVKANFDLLMRWVRLGIPLPFGGLTNNRRSLLALDNLVDFISICLQSPNAANQTFLVSDGEDLSTADLVMRLGTACGRRARLFYVPPPLLERFAGWFNQRALYQRLGGSLQLDIRKASRLLGWVPPVSVDEGFRRTAGALTR